MNFDVFISYSTKDAVAAKAACAAMEVAKIRCWIAPRDIVPGAKWGASIVRAVNECRVMVLIFSGNANSSAQVQREVDQAFSRAKTVVPLRIEDVKPVDDLAYYLDTVHWLDALSPPLEKNLERLVATVTALLTTAVPSLPDEAPPVHDDTSAARAQDEARAEDERRLRTAEVASNAPGARHENETAAAERRQEKNARQRTVEAAGAQPRAAAERERDEAEAEARVKKAEARQRADAAARSRREAEAERAARKAEREGPRADAVKGGDGLVEAKGPGFWKTKPLGIALAAMVGGVVLIAEAYGIWHSLASTSVPTSPSTSAPSAPRTPRFQAYSLDDLKGCRALRVAGQSSITARIVTDNPAWAILAAEAAEKRLKQSGVRTINVTYLTPDSDITLVLQRAVDIERVGVLVHCGSSSAIKFDQWVQKHDF